MVTEGDSTVKFDSQKILLFSFLMELYLLHMRHFCQLPVYLWEKKQTDFFFLWEFIFPHVSPLNQRLDRSLDHIGIFQLTDEKNVICVYYQDDWSDFNGVSFLLLIVTQKQQWLQYLYIILIRSSCCYLNNTNHGN